MDAYLLTTATDLAAQYAHSVLVYVVAAPLLIGGLFAWAAGR